MDGVSGRERCKSDKSGFGIEFPIYFNMRRRDKIYHLPGYTTTNTFQFPEVCLTYQVPGKVHKAIPGTLSGHDPATVQMLHP